MNNENIKEVEFKNCETCGDEIKALVRKYTNSVIGTFVLEQVIIQIKENDAKIEELKEKLLN